MTEFDVMILVTTTLGMFVVKHIYLSSGYRMTEVISLYFHIQTRLPSSLSCKTTPSKHAFGEVIEAWHLPEK